MPAFPIQFICSLSLSPAARFYNLALGGVSCLFSCRCCWYSCRCCWWIQSSMKCNGENWNILYTQHISVCTIQSKYNARTLSNKWKPHDQWRLYFKGTEWITERERERGRGRENWNRNGNILNLFGIFNSQFSLSLLDVLGKQRLRVD